MRIKEGIPVCECSLSHSLTHSLFLPAPNSIALNYWGLLLPCTDVVLNFFLAFIWETFFTFLWIFFLFDFFFFWTRLREMFWKSITICKQNYRGIITHLQHVVFYHALFTSWLLMVTGVGVGGWLVVELCHLCANCKNP